MSARHDLAVELAAWVTRNHLAEVYGGDVIQSETRRGRPYEVGFSVRCNLDGHVLVYGRSCFIAQWQTRYQNMPGTGSRKLTSLAACQDFLRKAFIELLPDAKRLAPAPEKGPWWKADDSAARTQGESA